MAKSEAVAYDDSNVIPFDQEELLHQNLRALPDDVEIVGTWKFQFINGFVNGGTSAKGPWRILTLVLNPIEPVGDHDYNAEELDDLPQVKHRMFYTKTRDRKAFVALADKFGVDESVEELVDILAEMKGEYIIATARPGKDNRGETETKLSNFRPIDYDE